MPKTGNTSKAVAKRLERSRRTFFQTLEEERKIAYGDHATFATFYGMKPDELPTDQKVYNYSFSRTGGTNLARLFMLGAGFSFEDVFMDKQRDTGSTPEEIAHNNMVLDAKRTMGDAVLRMLNELPEEEIAKKVAKLLVSQMPQYVEKINGLVEHKYSSPLAVRTKEQLLATRMAEYMFDLYQDTTKSERYKEILDNEAEEYHKNHPGEPKLDYSRYSKIAYSLMNDRYHGRYKESIENYLHSTGEERTNVLNQLILEVIGAKYCDGIRENNMKKGMSVQDAFTFANVKQSELIKGECIPYVGEYIYNELLDRFTEDEIDEALLSGRLADSVEIDVAEDGSVKSLSCLGVNYDVNTNMITHSKPKAVQERKIPTSKSGYTVHFLDRKNEKNKDLLFKLQEEEGKTFLTRPEVFKQFYGDTTAADVKRTSGFHNYSFDRDAGIDLARLYLLCDGFSEEDVFMDQTKDSGSTKEEIEHNNMILEAKKKAGEQVLKLFEQPDEVVNQMVANMLVSQMPKILKKWGEVAENKFPNPLEKRTEKQLLSERISGFLYNMYQDTVGKRANRDAFLKVFDDYNKSHPDTLQLNYDKFVDIGHSAGNDVYRSSYLSDMAEYLKLPSASKEDEEAKEEALAGFFASCASTKYRDSIREKNVKSGKGVYESFTEKEAGNIPAPGFFRADFLTHLKDPLLSVYSKAELEDAILTGKFYDSLHVELNDDGSIKELSCLDVKYRALDGTVTMPRENTSDMEYRADALKECFEVQKEADAYIPATEENFLALTGYKKADYLKDTDFFGFNLDRQTVHSFLIAKLLAGGMSLEDAIDPTKHLAVKHQEAERFRKLIAAPIPKTGTPEYEKRLQAVTNYAVDAYWNARIVLEHEIREANNHPEFITNPNAVYTTTAGRKALAAVVMAHDLNQELTKDYPKKILDSKRQGAPTPSEELTKLGFAGYGIKNIDRVRNLANGLLRERTADLNMLVRFALDNAMTANNLQKKKDALAAENKKNGTQIAPNYFNFYTVADVEELMTIQLSENSEKLKNRFISELKKRYSSEEIAKKALSGELIKSVRFTEKNGDIVSLSMLDLKVEKVGKELRCTRADGTPLPDDMSVETQDLYKKRIGELVKAANDTNELLVFGNTQNYKDFIKSMNDLKKLLNEDEISFDQINDALAPVKSSIERYQRAHKDIKLDNFQKRRLAVMDQVMGLSNLASKYVKDPYDLEKASPVLGTLRAERYDMERKKVYNHYSTNDGRRLLIDRTIEATKRIYNILLNKTEITQANKEEVIHDLKTIALSKIVEKEAMLTAHTNSDIISQTLSKHPDHIDDLISSANIGSLANHEAFKNPTLENINKLIKENEINEAIHTVIKESSKKVEEKQLREKAAKEAEAKAKEQENAEKWRKSMALTEQEIKWYKSFIEVLQNAGVRTNDKLDLMDIVIFDDIHEQLEKILEFGKLEKKNRTPQAINNYYQNVLDGHRRACVPAFVKPDESGHAQLKGTDDQRTTIEWIKDETLLIDVNELDHLSPEKEAKIKALYQYAKQGRLHYAPGLAFKANQTNAITVSDSGEAILSEESANDIYNKVDKAAFLTEEEARIYNVRLNVARVLPSIKEVTEQGILSEEQVANLNKKGAVFGDIVRIATDKRINEVFYEDDDESRQIRIDDILLQDEARPAIRLKRNDGSTPTVQKIMEFAQFRGKAVTKALKKLYSSDEYRDAIETMKNLRAELAVYDKMLEELKGNDERTKERRLAIERQKLYCVNDDFRENWIEQLAGELRESRAQRRIGNSMVSEKDIKRLETQIAKYEQYRDIEKAQKIEKRFHEIGEYLVGLQVDRFEAGIFPSYLMSYMENQSSDLRQLFPIVENHALTPEQKEELYRDAKTFVNPKKVEVDYSNLDFLAKRNKVSSEEYLTEFSNSIVKERLEPISKATNIPEFANCVIIDGQPLLEKIVTDGVDGYHGMTADEKLGYISSQITEAFKYGKKVQLTLSDQNGVFHEPVDFVPAKTDLLTKQAIERRIEIDYSIFDGEEPSKTVNIISALRRQTDNAEVLRGKHQFDEMQAAIHHLDEFTQNMARNLHPNDLEQVSGYKAALVKAYKKAEAYIEYKGRVGKNPREQRRIKAALDIMSYTELKVKSMDRYISKLSTYIPEEAKADYNRNVREIQNKEKNERYLNLYQKLDSLDQKNCLDAMKSELENDPSLLEPIMHGGMKKSTGDRSDSLVANAIEYYRQTNKVSEADLLNFVYDETDDLYGILSDYAKFMRKNEVFKDPQKIEKLLPTPETSKCIKAQADFYKEWYQSLEGDGILKDYFELDEKQVFQKIRFDFRNAINVSQNSDSLRAVYLRECADAFGGVKEMDRYAKIASIKQYTATLAQQMYDPNEPLGIRVAAKEIYKKIMSEYKGKSFDDIPEARIEHMSTALLAMLKANLTSPDEFTKEELDLLYADAEPDSLKAKFEAIYAECYEAVADKIEETTADRKQETVDRILKVEKEKCAEIFYETYINKLKEEGPEKLLEALSKAEGRNEFIAKAMECKMIEELAKHGDTPIEIQNPKRMLGELIVEMKNNQQAQQNDAQNDQADNDLIGMEPHELPPIFLG